MFGHVQRREGHGCSEGEPRKETAGRRRLNILLLRGDVGVPDGEADEAKETKEIRAGLRRCWDAIFKYSNRSQ